MKKTINSKNLVALMIAVSMIFGSVATSEIVAQAATYTVGNQSLAINEGMATLTVNGSETVQLTRALVTKDGGIDQSTGIVYLLWMSNSLYAYSYELQKSTGVQLVLVDTGVLSLTTNGSAVTGYDVSSGHKSLLTLDEMRIKLGISNSSSNSSGSSTNNGSNGSNSGTNNPTGNSGTVPTQTQPTNSTTTPTNTTVSSNLKDNLSVSNNQVTLRVNENGTIKTYILPTAGVSIIDRVGIDANNTIWVRYVNGQIDVWNYDLQRNEGTIKLYTITKKSTALIFDANGYVIGYYVTGNNTMQSILTKDQYTVKFINSSTTTATGTKYVKYYVVTGTIGKNLRDSNNKIIDHFRFNVKTGKASYKGKSYKKVRRMFFTKKGKVAITFKNTKKNIHGKTIIVNKHNEVVKTIKNVKKYKQDRGFGTYAVRYDGSKVKLANY